MAPETVIYLIPGHQRSKSVCDAMKAGIERVGDRVRVASSLRYTRPEADVAVFYGLAGRLHRVLREYGDHPKRKALYIDLGYWGRKEGGRFSGYHKISLDDRHPTAYFQARKHDASRADRFDLKVQPWKKGGKHILLIGMGPKGARAEGFAPREWEREALKRIRAVTKRPVIYRPKPNWENAPPIPGCEFDDPRRATPLEALLRDCHAVVSHHSNACVEALLAGVPIFTEEGVASPMGLSDLAEIERPIFPAGRRQWANDIAWCQWSVAEMAEGLPWRHLKDEGLIP